MPASLRTPPRWIDKTTEREFWNVVLDRPTWHDAMRLRMKLIFLPCTLTLPLCTVACVDPSRGVNWLDCSLITTDAGAKDIAKHKETYLVNFDTQKLYSYNPSSKEVIGPMTNVSFWPGMINQETEASANNFSTDHVLRINLKTMEIVNRLDTMGTGFNSGASSHSVMGGTCKWISPLQVG
jgi:hypothetical protein